MMRPGRISSLTCALALLFALVAGAAGTSARAENLSIGLGSEVTTLDPHFHNLTPNSIVASHVFDALTLLDEHRQPMPGLAVHWRAVDDRTWEFVLRRNIQFHDDTPFTAADAAASLRRALDVKDSPYPFSAVLRTVTDITVENDHVLRVHTAVPDPLVPAAVGKIAVIPARFANAARGDFDSGRAMIGTGPFRFVSNRDLKELSFTANTAYWGGRPPWEGLTIRILPNAADRVTALTAGAVHVIDQVPPADVARLHTDPEITVRTGLSARLIYLALDSGREQTPFITDRAGQPLPHNPLKDVRVRKAFSMAINRAGLVDLVMEGLAYPAGQMLPEGFLGTSPTLKPDVYDPEGAKRLLAEAGFPNGFLLTLHATNNRYTNDAEAARTLGVALSRIGVTTKVETLPAKDFFMRVARQDFSAYMSGITSGLGETTDVLLSLVASWDAARNRGGLNRARYSNQGLDALLDKAAVTLDARARDRLLRRASEMAMADAAVLPLYFESKVWAMRREYTFSPRADEFTLATEVEPTKPSAAR